MMGNMMGNGLDPFHTLSLSHPVSVIRCHPRFVKRCSHEMPEWTIKDKTETHALDEATNWTCGVNFST